MIRGVLHREGCGAIHHAAVIPSSSRITLQKHPFSPLTYLKSCLAALNFRHLMLCPHTVLRGPRTHVTSARVLHIPSPIHPVHTSPINLTHTPAIRMHTLPAPRLVSLVRPKPPVSVPWRQLPHITQSRLPDKPTDIRGIDSFGHVYMERKRLLRTLPPVSQNKFFTLRFMPKEHHLSSIRKSNVAFTFTNFGSAILNDAKLLQLFSAYKGKYKKADFFNTVPVPCGTAASRDKNRKLIKRTLHEMLHEVGEVSKVSGIFVFRFHDYAVTEEQNALLRQYLRASVEKVCSDTFRERAMKAVQEQNRSFSKAEMMKGIRFENTMGASSVPGYYPKLPYLQRK